MDLTRSQVDRAGQLWSRFLRRYEEVGDACFGEFDAGKLEQAQTMIEGWRRHHAETLSSVSANLRYYAREQGEPEVTQRLKRFRSIVRKLSRERGMRLTQMADIGGVRAVLPTQDAARSVARRLRRNWTIVRLRDYVEDPKADGYRALHLIARRRGRLIEVQLRTPFQDLWANVVEEESRLIGADLKSGEGPKEVRDAYRDLADRAAAIEAHAGAQQELMAVMQGLLALTDRLRSEKRRDKR